MLRGRALRTSTQGRFEQAAVALEVDEVHFETSYTPMPAAAVANRPRLFAPSVRFRVAAAASRRGFFCQNLHKQGPRGARIWGAPLPHSRNALAGTSCSVCPPAGGPSGGPGVPPQHRGPTSVQWRGRPRQLVASSLVWLQRRA
jgi:hypothetical protein